MMVLRVEVLEKNRNYGLSSLGNHFRLLLVLWKMLSLLAGGAQPQAWPFWGHLDANRDIQAAKWHRDRSRLAAAKVWVLQRDFSSYLYLSNHINVNLIVLFTCTVITRWNVSLRGQRENR